MSVVRNTPERLTLRDDLSADGERLDVERFGHLVRFATQHDGGPAFKLDDVLVLLSWLADAAGVERYVPPSTCDGCCSSCGGVGVGGPASGPETNGRCADCYGDGHDGPCEATS